MCRMAPVRYAIIYRIICPLIFLFILKQKQGKKQQQHIAELNQEMKQGVYNTENRDAYVAFLFQQKTRKTRKVWDKTFFEKVEESPVSEDAC